MMFKIMPLGLCFGIFTIYLFSVVYFITSKCLLHHTDINIHRWLEVIDILWTILWLHFHIFKDCADIVLVLRVCVGQSEHWWAISITWLTEKAEPCVLIVRWWDMKMKKSSSSIKAITLPTRFCTVRIATKCQMSNFKMIHKLLTSWSPYAMQHPGLVWYAVLTSGPSVWVSEPQPVTMDTGWGVMLCIVSICIAMIFPWNNCLLCAKMSSALKVCKLHWWCWWPVKYEMLWSLTNQIEL